MQDALYAAEPMVRLCRENGWQYLFTHKAERQKNLEESYGWIKGGNWAEVAKGICAEKRTGFYAKHVEEQTGKTEVMNVYEYQSVDKKGRTVKFRWVTSLALSKRNLEEMVLAGWDRWRIENQGFNNQKNGLYRIERLNGRNSNAMKNHYLFTQISDILMQLYLAWNLWLKEIGQGIKNTSSRLLESFRRQTVTDEDASYIHRYTTVYLE